MTTVSASPAAIAARPISYVEWGPIIAGAVAAVAIAFVLLTFGSAIGLTAVSPWPNSGLPAWLIAVIAALWLLIVQAGSYALGGYIAGRLRAPFAEAKLAERQFRDGAHGFLVWALGVVISAIVVSYAAGALTRTGVEATSNVVGGAAQGAAAGASSALANAADPISYAVDRLFRQATTEAESAAPAESTDTAPATAATPAPAPEAATTAVDSSEEVSRIFLEGLANNGLAADDRAYLAAQVAARTGLPPAEAEKRVDDAFAAVQQAEAEAREAVDEARRAAAIGAFLTGAALLIAAAAAAAGAGLGGRHRDENGALRVLGRERFW